MLQIISGKFFAADVDRYQHHRKGVLYSNFSWVAPIETCIGVLEPIDSYRAVSTYVFSYVNQIEKNESAGGVVCVGDSEIVRQYSLLCMFGLGAHFAHDSAMVLSNCRRRASSGNDQFVPAHFTTRLFNEQISGTQADVDSFAVFVKRCIGMPRSRYLGLVSALSNMNHALQVLNWNLDLAYSMLVYSLESLSQKFDNHEPKWLDYDQNTRSKLDMELSTLDDEKANAIRQTLLSAGHQKLSARFIGFVESHLRDDFFIAECPGRKSPLRKSHLRQALKNAYGLRSRYVHELDPILNQLHVPHIARGEVLLWERQPFLTFDGLLKVCLEVIKSFVDTAPQVETEDFEWRRGLPGSVVLKMAPQYWISKHEGIDNMPTKQLSEQVRTVLGGFLANLVDVLPNGKPMADLHLLLKQYRRRIPRAPRRDAIRMLVIDALFNGLLGENAEPDWKKFVYEDHKNDIEHDCLEILLASLVLYDGVSDVSYEVCEKIYADFTESRYGKSAIDVPPLLELKLQCEIANLALDTHNDAGFIKFASLALHDAVGYAEQQQTIRFCRERMEKLEHGILFPLRRTDP